MGSKIVIGGYDLENFAKPGATVEWTDLITNSYWGVPTGGVMAQTSLGASKHFNFSLESTSRMAILDSGTSYVLMPSADFYAFILELYEKLDLVFSRFNKRSRITAAQCSMD